jgi:medium-chain acyl-[acyl-carrier-protein] hydrolase
MSQAMSNSSPPLRHATAWLSCPRPDPAAKVRLFCLPYAGAGGSIYRNWPARLAGVAEVRPILLPGREARFRDRPHTHMQSLAAAIAEGIGSHLDRPFALFGHSMGALIAFELACRIQRDRGLSPVCLFVSGSRPPHAVWTEAPVHSLPDREFLDCLHDRYHAIPEAVRENRELAEIVLPALRADFEILETYRCEDATRLRCPIVAYGGMQDDTVTCEELESWGRHTENAFQGRMLPGDHFFLRLAEAELLADLSRHLCSES